ncbi:MAG: hypothetical protein ABSF60_05775 [Verrucomicrobiota bacterium]
MKDRLFKELMALPKTDRSKALSDLTEVVQRAALRTKCARVPCLVTIKQAVKKQLAADLRYCQSEGVDVAAFIKAKYKV